LVKAGPLTGTAYSPAVVGYRKAVTLIIAGALILVLLIMQLGKAGRIEQRAEIAFARAKQLLHEADKENRNIRPFPLSLATAGNELKLV
jgi:hypothetical protein